MELSPKLEQIRAQALQHYNKLTFRERGILATLVAVTIFIGIFYVVDYTLVLYDDQNQGIAALDRELELLPSRLTSYAKLASRKEALEKSLEEKQITQGIRSHIEEIIKNVINTNVTVALGEPEPVGAIYEKVQSKVSGIYLSDWDKLVELLKQLGLGKNSINILRLNIRKTPGSNSRLELQITASSIRKKESSGKIEEAPALTNSTDAI